MHLLYQKNKQIDQQLNREVGMCFFMSTTYDTRWDNENWEWTETGKQNIIHKDCRVFK